MTRREDETATAWPDPSAVDQLRPELPARWKVVRLLGRGGQGWVWLAEDQELGEEVAIKVVSRPEDPTAQERLRRELRLGRRLRHPNLVQLYEAIEARDALAIVMEHAPGGSLRDRCAEAQPIATVVELGAALLGALAHLHEHGIIHRDVKPSNVLLNAEGTPLLGDFGTMLPVSGDGLTRTGVSVGTPAYMSPEQIRGETVTPASDLYSLGVTLYWLLTGQRPISGSSDLDVAHRQLTVDPLSVRVHRRDCPRWLARFVGRLLEKDPRHRWPDAAAALEALHRRRPGLSVRRLRRAAVALGVVAIVGVVAAVLAVSFGSQAAPSTVRVPQRGAVEAFAESGDRIWERRVEGALVAEMGDLVAVSGREVLVAASAMGPVELTDLALYVLSSSGHDAAQLQLRCAQSELERWAESFELKQYLLHDVDRDGWEDVAWAVNHRLSYPSVVGIWFPESGGLQRLLVNSGHVLAMRSADLDGTGAPEIVVLAVNNVLGDQLVVATLRYLGPMIEHTVSPDLLSPRMVGKLMKSTASYTVLGEYRGQQSLVSAGRGGIEIRRGAQRIVLDSAGNPSESPLYGMDGTVRRQFWADLALLAARVAQAPESEPGRLISRFAEEHPLVWSELPARVATYLALAERLAAAGRPAAAVRCLSGLRDVMGDEPVPVRVVRRQGELAIVHGDFGDGVRLLEEALYPTDRSLPSAAAGISLVLHAACTGDGDLLRRSLDLLRSLELLSENLEARLQFMAAFLAGRWEEAATRDVSLIKDELTDPVILRLWAMLDQGALFDTIGERLELFEQRRDLVDVCALVRARAAIADGRPESAAARLRPVIGRFEVEARRGVLGQVRLGLASWLLGSALAAGDDLEAAGPHLERVVVTMPGSWFGVEAQRLLTSEER